MADSLWQRFRENFLAYEELGFSIDISRMRFPADLFEKLQPGIARALADMQAAGARCDREPGRAADGRALLAARAGARA